MISTTAGNALNVCLLEVSCEYKRTDAVLDRVCQAAHRVALRGASMRKRQPAPAADEADITAGTRGRAP